MPQSRKEILKVEDLSIQFGGLKAVDNLSFTIYEKEIFGLIGPNGAGKTTVFNCITQFYKPDTGSIIFTSNKGDSIELTTQPVHKIINYGLVRTFQNVELVQELSVLDNVLIGGHINFKSGVVHQFFNTKKARKEETEQIEKAMDILKIFEIEDMADQIVSGLPYGVLKKVEFARAMMANPKLIILDEPAAGLNDVETIQLAQMIRDIRDKYDCAILLVEHDMRLVMDVCDQICAISFGKHLATGDAQTIQKDKKVQEAYLGVSDV